METKKNPEKDVHRMSGMFFQLGLGVSISIIIIAFEWTSEFKKPVLKFIEDPGTPLVYVPVTDLIEPPPPSPIKNEIKPMVTKSFNPTIETTSDDKTESDTPAIDIDPISYSLPIIIEHDSMEAGDVVLTFPEKAAEPIGGYSSFYDLLKKNMKYPSQAKRYGVEGKVFVEFIINKDGTPVDFKTIRGVGYGCDEEAIRVISLSKWNPGKQRGRPVRVRMVLPVVFKLQ